MAVRTPARRRRCNKLRLMGAWASASTKCGSSDCTWAQMAWDTTCKKEFSSGTVWAGVRPNPLRPVNAG